MLVLGLVLALVTLGAAQRPFTLDAWWHFQSGDFMLDRHTIPRQDPFAWTALGRPWRLNSWLYDVLVATLHRGGGRGALVAVTLIAVVLLGAACYVLARRAGARPWPSVASASVLTFLLTPFIAERPQLLSYLVFAVTLMVAPRALRGSNRALAGLAALFVFWVNLHFAFTTGVVLIGLLAAAIAIQEHRLRRAAIVTGVVAAAGLVNPFGWRAYSAAFEARGTSRVIQEWQHLDATRVRDLAYLFLIVLVLASLWRTGRWRRLECSAPVVVFSLLAIDAVRNVPFLILVAAAELAVGCSALHMRRLRKWVQPRKQLAIHGLSLGLAVLVLMSLPGLIGARPASSDTTPVRTTAAIPGGCRLLNQYEFGGYISEQRWPAVLVSQDDRNGLEQDFLRQHDVINDRPGALEWIDDQGVDCVLVPPDEPIVDRLLRDGWDRAASEPSAVLLLRP